MQTKKHKWKQLSAFDGEVTNFPQTKFEPPIPSVREQIAIEKPFRQMDIFEFIDDISERKDTSCPN